MLRRTSRSWAPPRQRLGRSGVVSLFAGRFLGRGLVVGPLPRLVDAHSGGHGDDGQGQEQGRGEAAQRGHGRVAPAPAAEPFDHGAAPGLDRPVFQEALQVLGQCGGTGIAVGRFLVQAFQADRLQIAGQLGPQARWSDRLMGHDLAQGLQGRFRLERRPAGEQLVEDRTQGVDVGRRPDRLVPAGRLLRRHVAGRAQAARRSGCASRHRR